MKLAISNIAWENSELNEHLELISQLGCEGVELAPSCIWPEPVDASKSEREDLKKLVEDNGLSVVSFHALFYTRPDLEIMASEKQKRLTGEYLKKLFELCADLGGKNLIFGSPKSRKRNGKGYQECLSICADFFRNALETAKQFDVYLCVEPLDIKESDFINSCAEAISLISAVDHPHFGLHLDAKALVDSKEDIKKILKQHIGILRHFHVSEPDLAPPGTSGFDHTLFGKALTESSYNGYVSIEMRRGFGNSRDIVKSAIEYTRKNYFLEKT